MGTARINDGHASYFAEASFFPRPSMLKLISLLIALGASLCLALGPHPPLTMRSCFTGREGVIVVEIAASRVYISQPLRFE